MKRRTRAAAKRASKQSRRRAMAAAGITTGHKSRFAQKVDRKRGGGRVEPTWMWWLDRGGAVEVSS